MSRFVQETPREREERDTLRSLCDLSQHSEVVMQWIPSHCGLSGNDEADRLARSGSKEEQPMHKISYGEAKTLIQRQFHQKWTEAHPSPSDDGIKNLQRQQQTILFRLRTGHCRLRYHMYRLGLCHSPDCPCETGPQTPEHILQSCPLYQAERSCLWPQGATLQEKLWGTKDQLVTTATFISSLKIEV